MSYNPIQSTLNMIFASTSGKTITNTTTQTTGIASGIGSLTLPADYLTVGKQLRLSGGGVYTTPLLASSIIVRVKLGSTVISTATTSALITLGTNMGFSFQMLMTCRSVGASGSVVIDGHANYAAVTRIFDDMNNLGAPVTINTTIAQDLDITLQWDAATTTRSVTISTFALEALN